MKKAVISIIFFLCSSLFAFNNFTQNSVNEFVGKYGNSTTNILKVWDGVIDKAKRSDDLQKLKIINDFFNNVKYLRDIQHWKQKDYWATPFEFVGTRAGDCEDYAIAKYFTLLKVGIPESKLRIAYVKLQMKRTQFEEAHMVLLYFHRSNMVPIVLDNVNKRLQMASKRGDLKLIYSFNADGLWEAKNKGRKHIKRGTNNLKKWKTLIQKI